MEDETVDLAQSHSLWQISNLFKLKKRKKKGFEKGKTLGLILLIEIGYYR
jgi:hypothetical protein